MSEEFVPLSPSLSELSSTSTSTLVQMLPNGDIVDCACLPGTARNTLYKTERCKHFDKTGVCKYGDKCQFAHGGNELRSVLRHPKYKTTLCKAFATKGKCLYGSRCRFIHQKMNDYIREHPDEMSSIIYPEESFMLSDETNLSEDTASTSGESDTKDSRSNDALQFTDASLKSSKDTFCNSKFSSYDIRSASPVDGNGKNNFSTYLNNNFYNEKTISIDSIYATFDYAEDEEKNSEPLHIEFDFLKDNIESINTATILPINETTSISTSISTLPSLTSTSTSMKTIFNHSLFINPQSYTIDSINNQKKLTTRLSVFDQIYHVNDLTL